MFFIDIIYNKSKSKQLINKEKIDNQKERIKTQKEIQRQLSCVLYDFVDQILGQKEFCCQFMSQSQSSTLYENDSYLSESLTSGSNMLNDKNNYTRGRASQVSNQSILYVGRKNASMVQHVVQSSPQHFSISNKLNESFGSDLVQDQDNSTQHRNSSFSNSNGGGSFISRSGNGRILSDQNLSPLCNKLSDLSNGGGFSNSFNYGNRQINTSTSSYSSLNDNIEMSNSLLLAKEYLEKDESLIDQNIFELLFEDLHTLNSNSIKEYYNKIITSFQNDDDYSQFFNENQFIEDQVSSKKIINLQSNSSICTNLNSLNDVSSTSPMNEAFDFQTFDTIQDFDNSQQNLKVGSAMSSLIFQINPQKHFRNTMILTFDYFMTPLTFLLYVIKCYYIPKPIGLSEKEEEKFDKRMEQIRINIGQVIRDYVEIRSSEFLQSNITSVLLIVFFQTIPSNSKEKSLFTQLAEKVKEKKTQYELQNLQKSKRQAIIYNSSCFSTNSSSTYPQNIYQKSNPQNTSFSAPNNLMCLGQSNSSILSEELMRIEKKNKQIQRHLSLYELSPLLHYQTETIAKVLAQIDAKWFIRLNISNLINSKVSVCSKSSYVKKYSNRFNYYVYWFKNQVLNQKQIDNRVSQIYQYIEIMIKLDQEYRSYPTVHALYTVISYMQNQLPQTWKRLEEKLRAQKKWVSITLELQEYQKMFNDKYYGYKQTILKHQENRKSYIPCMNPYLQDIYNDEMKFTAVSAKKNSSGNQLVVPRVIHERIGDRLLNLSVLQKQCEKVFPNQDNEYKDFRNTRNDESQLYTIFKKKCVKEIDDLLLQNCIQFKDLELYFIGKCKEIEPN
ncbi:RasGEF domain protein (macronuclear) [Tetrahymena thermophila SB210]|uniref:RasGEF domain protein n=1 Tax=Tetrahymena thermophila (strain SB210) TaxID=312017 RepID=Q234T9_TETTS|nr:RasGEF domain protein [Tetrahymena thermophila SB210]EAR91914.2 RasGEF domain protein [Tetrahymena thermophila SB210]|eukprot:XP_001012159.2 RasGEF domain protein [Tetrahymena thermophila SB210]